MPPPKRRSSSSSSGSRTWSGRALFPPPTMMGARNRWTSSTSPALKASAARCGPPTVRSRSADAFSRRTASGSKSRSTLVLVVSTVSSVLE